LLNFWGVKIGKHLQLRGRAHYRVTRKNLESRTQLDEPAECISGGDPLLLYRILHLLFFPLIRILCALRHESRKKNYEDGLDTGPLGFQFLRLRGYLTNPFRALPLYFGVTGKTPGIISHNNFVKNFMSASVIAMICWQDVIRSSLCSGVKDCGTKRAHKFLFPKSSFRIRRTTVLGMFKDSTIILDAIRGHF